MYNKNQQKHLKINDSKYIKKLIHSGSPSKINLLEIKKILCREQGLTKLPRNSDIFNQLPTKIQKQYNKFLMVKPIRTASGVAVVALMAKPSKCKHGICLYCPGGINYGTPQSFTGREPTSMRSAENNYDSYKQVLARLNQLITIGHDVSKTELIIIGGTFLNFPKKYRDRFVKGCFDGLNGKRALNLKDAHKLNETAKIRNVGFTLETRPDFCKPKHIDLMLDYGVTRIEIGVQTLDDKIFRLVNRGHSTQDVIEAFQAAKDSGYKIVAHMMPGLPGSNPLEDLKNFHKLLYNPDFKPDMLKIYPTVILKNTGLYNEYLAGKYRPYDLTTVVNLLADVKSFVPKWVRIMRIQREIPAYEIVSGVKNGNLRELVLEEVRRRGHSCKCIRCREIGLKKYQEKDHHIEDMKLFKEVYDSSEGTEIFLSFEDINIQALIGFLRLRIPSQKVHRTEISERQSCIVRELHIYGSVVPIGLKDKERWQHRGFGKKLITEAEKIASEDYDANKIVILSAVGTREYYKKLGYFSEGPYMVRCI
jgi:elongator complex protein 3